MARSSIFLLILLFTSLSTSRLATAVHHDFPSNAKLLDLNLNLNWGSGDGFGMSSYEEHTRRVLAGNSRYIGYEALRRDSVPCGRRGASYYNCRPGAHANPYSRGCSAITRCRR